MLAGGAPPRAGGSAPRAVPPPDPRAGGGPSGTTTALVMVVSASFRVARLSHGVAATAAARSRNALPVMVSPRTKTQQALRLKRLTLSQNRSHVRRANRSAGVT